MKRVISLAVVCCLADIVSAMSYRIGVEQSIDDAGKITVSYGDVERDLGINEEVNLDDFAVGFWNGEIFSICSSKSITKETAPAIKIRARRIKVDLNSLIASKCEINSLDIRILGESYIKDFSVKGMGGTEIKGSLFTKSFKGGISTATVDGQLYFYEDGFLECGGLVNNGTLLLSGNLTVRATGIGLLSSGVIVHEENDISKGNLIVQGIRFFNESHGYIKVRDCNIKTDKEFQNNGELRSINLLVARDFIQKGQCVVYNQLDLSGHFNNFGNTEVNLLNFINISQFNASEGSLMVHEICGNVSILQVNKGAEAYIKNFKGFLGKSENLGGFLEIGSINSTNEGYKKKTYFSVKEEGKTRIGQLIGCESIRVAEAGLLDIGNSDKEAIVSVKGSGVLKTGEASINILSVEEDAEAKIEGSTVKRALVKGRNNTLFSSEIGLLHNTGEVEVVDSHVDDLKNQNTVEMYGQTSVDNLSNRGKVVAGEGDHFIGQYLDETGKSSFIVEGDIGDAIPNTVGMYGQTYIDKLSNRGNVVARDGDHFIGQYLDETGKSSFIVEGNIGEAVSNRPSKDQVAVLQSEKTRVAIKELFGLGGLIYASNQIYNKMPIAFRTEGNVFVLLDHMPVPQEIPDHSYGKFNILVDLEEDYVNKFNINYNDALFFIKMNGHKWANIESSFIAGGLTVANASVFENRNGRIDVERMLNIRAGQFYNIANPLARENGRWVTIHHDGESLSYYCPATYYSTNMNTGIIAVGDINITVDENVINQFSNIRAGGTFRTKSKTFDNKVANIMAFGQGKSSIEAEIIKNESLPAFLRQGEGHLSKSGGGLFNRWSWSVHSYTREWITQSHGSSMIFRGDVDFKGYTENFGSKVLSGGLLTGNINSRSLLENTSVVGASGMAMEGDFLRYESSLLFSHSDRIANYNRLNSSSSGISRKMIQDKS